MEPTRNPIINVLVLCGGLAFGSFGISALGSLLENTTLLMFWYLGLTALFLLPPLLAVAGLSRLWTHNNDRHPGQTGDGPLST